MSAKAVIPTTTSQGSPADYEDTHVHSVYNTIAHHFSSTRYKPWPVVAAFLASMPPGSIGLDAGCGNGKYLIALKEREGSYWTIGLDRSARLLEIAKRAGDKDRECVIGDVLDTPWRNGIFDFAISIATIHHLSTPERRKKSVQSLLKSISPSNGRGLIYVWAIQQDGLSKRSVPDPAGKADHEHTGQDVFVPWVLTDSSASESLKEKSSLEQNLDATNTPVFNRYYHMFDKGELRELVTTAAGEMGICVCSEDFESSNDTPGKAFMEIVNDDWERSNYYVEFRLYQK